MAGNAAEDLKFMAVQDDVGEDMGPLESWLVYIVGSSSICVLLATMGACKWGRVLYYWGSDTVDLIRGYLQKMAMYNLLLLISLYTIYIFVYSESTDIQSEEECIKLAHHKFVVVIVVTGSLIVGIIRYLAVGIAHSDSFDMFGQNFDNFIGTNRSGFSIKGNEIYSRMLRPYKIMAGMVVVLMLVLLYTPIPTTYTDPILEIEFCLYGWPPKDEGYVKYLPVIVLIFLPTVMVLLVQHISHVTTVGVFTKTPGYIAVLNAPFIMVALTTTWSMWMILHGVVWWTFSLGAGEYFSMLALFYTSCDSLCLLFVTIVFGRTVRPTIAQGTKASLPR